MKKFISIIISAIFILNIFCVVGGLSVSAQRSGDYEYSVSDNTATITKYNGSSTSVTIPSSLDGYSVTSIGNSAFMQCGNLTNIYIPNSVTRIEFSAFEGCKSLTSITIPNSVTTIESSVFRSCKALLSITIPDSVKILERMAFVNCTSLMSVKLSKSLTTIEPSMFYGCTSLTSITIPNGVTNIGGNVFNGCTSLSDISIPNSVIDIGGDVFNNTLWFDNQPEGFVYAGKVAYKYKGKHPEHIDIKKGTLGIAGWAFSECTELKSIVIPDSVISIGEGAFYACENFVIYGNSNSYAQDYALNNNIPFVAIDSDIDKPSVVLFSTNNVASEQTVSISMSDNDGISGYYWGESQNYSENTFHSGSTTNITKTVNTSGTYYVTAVDVSGNVSDTKSITFYKTTLNPNGGSVSPTSVLTQSGNSFGFPIPTRTNYSYIGWAASSSSNNGIKELSPNSNSTYYAIWSYSDSENPTVALSSTNSISASQTLTISLQDNVSIKGYYFGTSSNYYDNTYFDTSSNSISKSIDASGTYYVTAVDSSDNLSTTQSIAFYKTTLNANGGSVSPTSILTKSGNSFSFPTPVRSNFSYVGWSESSSATSGVKSLSPSSNTTYYAIWKNNSNKFVWGQDNWRFNNSKDYFKNYNVNSKVLNLMKNDFNMSYSDIYELLDSIQEDNAYGWGGSCFGMTVSEIFVKQGDLKLSRYGGRDGINENTNTDDMVSVINFIQELQSVSRFSQIIRQSPFMSGNYPQSDFVDKIESVLSGNNSIVKLSFAIQNLNTNTGKYSYNGSHAVLGYGIEDCDYYSSVTGKRYDKKVLIADPNYLSDNKIYNEACMYYKSSDHSWILPYWNKKMSSSKIRCCYWNYNQSTNTGYIKNIIKYNSLTDMEDLMADYKVGHYIAGLEIENNSQNRTNVEQIDNSGNPSLDYAGESGFGIAPYNIDVEDNIEANNDNEQYALWNPTANYTVSYDNPSDFKLKMDYENIIYNASIENGTYAMFKPSGAIEFRGSNSSYSVTMVTDENVCSTDWYEVKVSGNNTDSFNYIKQKDGYVISASNLNNVKLEAKNNSVSVSRTFSTNYDRVFVYEIDENTIGIKVDKDNNGTFETELPTNETTQPTEPSSSESNATEPAKTSVTAKVDKSSIFVGDSISVDVTVENGIGATTYTSSNTAVATVSTNGVVKALKKGSVIITVGNNGEKATVKITIKQKANPMKVTAKKSVSANSKKKTAIKKAVTVKKAQGKVTYKTNNKKVTVKKGTMTIAKGLKKGKTYKVKVTITAKGNTKYKSAKKTVTVKIKVK